MGSLPLLLATLQFCLLGPSISPFLSGRIMVIKLPKRHLQSSRNGYGKSLQNYYYVKSIAPKVLPKACLDDVAFYPPNYYSI
jgi:hypothetical protein